MRKKEAPTDREAQHVKHYGSAACTVSVSQREGVATQRLPATQQLGAASLS